MASQQPDQQVSAAPYALNYSFNGMPEHQAQSTPSAEPHANNHETSSQASGASHDAIHGDRERSGGMPPHLQQQAPGAYSQYGPNNNSTPYMRPPPPYGSNTWQAPQHGYPAAPGSHAGPMRPHHGSEVSDYETFVAASQQHRPPPPPLHSAMRPPLRSSMRPPMRPPPSGQQSGYSSDTESSAEGYSSAPGSMGAHGRGARGAPKLTFLNCLKDSLSHIELTDLMPIAGVLGASVYHHYKHRHRDRVVPFQKPSWVNYLNNAVLAHHAYGRVKHAGGGGQYGSKHKPGGGGGIPWTSILGAVAGSAMARPGGPFGGGHGQQHQQQSYGRPQVGGYPPYGGRPHGGYNSNHNGGGGGGSGDMVTKVLGKIMGSLFGAKGGGGPMMGTRDISGSGGATTTHDDWDGFDSSDAVQKTVAEHYYRHIYRKRMDMRQATAQTLGGAAAIKVLRHESKMEQDIYGSGMPLPTDLQHDQVMMGLVLSEVGDLLELKAQAAPLHRDETLENVGRIAIATLVKIKIDESRAIDNVPTHRDSSSHDYYDRPPPPRKHASTRHRHRRQESGEESNYATREKDNHHYSH